MISILAQSDTLVQLGVGGAVAIIVLRTAFDFTKTILNNKKNGKGSNSDSDVIRRNEFETHKSSVVYKDTCKAHVAAMISAGNSRGTQIEKLDKKFDGLSKTVNDHLIEIRNIVKNGNWD